MPQPIYLKIEDPGHGWLRVPNQEIDAMHLASAISSFSFRDRDFWYLEEDCDAGIFLRACANRGRPIDAKSQITHHYEANFKNRTGLRYHTPPTADQPITIELVITHAHIHQAQQLEEYSCPVGCALRHCLGYGWQYSVGIDYITIWTESWDPRAICYERKLTQLPEQLLTFINAHDTGQPTAPLTVLLTFPPGVVIPNRRLAAN